MLPFLIVKTPLIFRRRFRALTCSILVALSVGFLYWDAGAASWIPGPHYLELWFAVVLVGGAALATLFIDVALVVRRHFRSRPVASAEAAPVAQMVPRS